jgi:hypothetical protein
MHVIAQCLLCLHWIVREGREHAKGAATALSSPSDGDGTQEKTLLATLFALSFGTVRAEDDCADHTDVLLAKHTTQQALCLCVWSIAESGFDTTGCAAVAPALFDAAICLGENPNEESMTGESTQEKQRATATRQRIRLVGCEALRALASLISTNPASNRWFGGLLCEPTGTAQTRAMVSVIAILRHGLWRRSKAVEQLVQGPPPSPQFGLFLISSSDEKLTMRQREVGVAQRQEEQSKLVLLPLLRLLHCVLLRHEERDEITNDEVVARSAALLPAKDRVELAQMLNKVGQLLALPPDSPAPSSLLMQPSSSEDGGISTSTDSSSIGAVNESQIVAAFATGPAVAESAHLALVIVSELAEAGTESIDTLGYNHRTQLQEEASGLFDVSLVTPPPAPALVASTLLLGWRCRAYAHEGHIPPKGMRSISSGQPLSEAEMNLSILHFDSAFVEAVGAIGSLTSGAVIATTYGGNDAAGARLTSSLLALWFKPLARPTTITVAAGTGRITSTVSMVPLIGELLLTLSTPMPKRPTQATTDGESESAAVIAKHVSRGVLYRQRIVQAITLLLAPRAYVPRPGLETASLSVRAPEVLLIAQLPPPSLEGVMSGLLGAGVVSCTVEFIKETLVHATKQRGEQASGAVLEDMEALLSGAQLFHALAAHLHSSASQTSPASHQETSAEGNEVGWLSMLRSQLCFEAPTGEDAAETDGADNDSNEASGPLRAISVAAELWNYCASTPTEQPHQTSLVFAQLCYHSAAVLANLLTAYGEATEMVIRTPPVDLLELGRGTPLSVVEVALQASCHLLRGYGCCHRHHHAPAEVPRQEAVSSTREDALQRLNHSYGGPECVSTAEPVALGVVRQACLVIERLGHCCGSEEHDGDPVFVAARACFYKTHSDPVSTSSPSEDSPCSALLQLFFLPPPPNDSHPVVWTIQQRCAAQVFTMRKDMAGDVNVSVLKAMRAMLLPRIDLRGVGGGTVSGASELTAGADTVEMLAQMLISSKEAAVSAAAAELLCELIRSSKSNGQHQLKKIVAQGPELVGAALRWCTEEGSCKPEKLGRARRLRLLRSFSTLLGLLSTIDEPGIDGSDLAALPDAGTRCREVLVRNGGPATLLDLCCRLLQLRSNHAAGGIYTADANQDGANQQQVRAKKRWVWVDDTISQLVKTLFGLADDGGAGDSGNSRGPMNELVLQTAAVREGGVEQRDLIGTLLEVCSLYVASNREAAMPMVTAAHSALAEGASYAMLTLDRMIDGKASSEHVHAVISRLSSTESLDAILGLLKADRVCKQPCTMLSTLQLISSLCKVRQVAQEGGTSLPSILISFSDGEIIRCVADTILGGSISAVVPGSEIDNQKMPSVEHGDGDILSQSNSVRNSEHENAALVRLSVRCLAALSEHSHPDPASLAVGDSRTNPQRLRLLEIVVASGSVGALYSICTRSTSVPQKPMLGEQPAQHQQQQEIALLMDSAHLLLALTTAETTFANVSAGGLDHLPALVRLLSQKRLQCRRNVAAKAKQLKSGLTTAAIDEVAEATTWRQQCIVTRDLVLLVAGLVRHVSTSVHEEDSVVGFAGVRAGAALPRELLEDLLTELVGLSSMLGQWQLTRNERQPPADVAALTSADGLLYSFEKWDGLGCAHVNAQLLLSVAAAIRSTTLDSRHHRSLAAMQVVRTLISFTTITKVQLGSGGSDRVVAWCSMATNAANALAALASPTSHNADDSAAGGCRGQLLDSLQRRKVEGMKGKGGGGIADWLLPLLRVTLRLQRKGFGTIAAESTATSEAAADGSTIIHAATKAMSPSVVRLLGEEVLAACAALLEQFAADRAGRLQLSGLEENRPPGSAGSGSELSLNRLVDGRLFAGVLLKLCDIGDIADANTEACTEGGGETESKWRQCMRRRVLSACSAVKSFCEDRNTCNVVLRSVSDPSYNTLTTHYTHHTLYSPHTILTAHYTHRTLYSPHTIH